MIRTILAPAPVPLGAGAFKQARDEPRLAAARRRVEEFLGRFTVRCAEAGVAGEPLEDAGDSFGVIALQVQR